MLAILVLLADARADIPPENKGGCDCASSSAPAGAGAALLALGLLALRVRSR